MRVLGISGSPGATRSTRGCWPRPPTGCPTMSSRPLGRARGCSSVRRGRGGRAGARSRRGLARRDRRRRRRALRDAGVQRFRPGQLKNALDWVSRPYATNPLRNTPAAVVGASTGGLRGLAQPICGASSQGSEHASSTSNWPGRTRSTRCHEDGSLDDDDVRQGLAGVVEELVSMCTPGSSSRPAPVCYNPAVHRDTGRADALSGRRRAGPCGGRGAARDPRQRQPRGGDDADAGPR